MAMCKLSFTNSVISCTTSWEASSNGLDGGISMESDFVEAPSQMLEEWISSPQVLAKFARHYKTGEPIPAELVERMNRASAFGRGGWVGRQNSFSAISYDIYKTKPENVDLDKVTLDDASRYTLFTPLPDTHQWASFGHLGGYSSAYYTYLWDKVIAEDFFLQFDHNNLLAGDAPMRYRRVVLEPGGSMSANDLVKNFLGRPQNITALQHWMVSAGRRLPALRHRGLSLAHRRARHAAARQRRRPLCDERLAWLERTLAAAPDRPTLIIMHHPPFRTGITQSDTLGLEGADRLRDIVGRNPQIERLLCGHVHRSIHVRFAGTIASIAPSTAHQVALDLRQDGPSVFVMEPPGYQLHLWDEGTGLVSHTAVIGDFAGPFPYA